MNAMPHSGKDDLALRDMAAALARMDNAAEIHEVLYALLTAREREAIALRWQLVCMLEEGMTQRAIATELGVSLCKITRGSHELKYGPEGFRNAIRRAVRRRAPGRAQRAADSKG
jgi:TrpR family trp operon transcriptional repressor